MILSAMIFAGLTLVIGFVLGFLLGQAKGRMSAEEKLLDAEAARTALARQVAELRAVSSAPASERKPGIESNAGPVRGSE
jgi:hypothetical protein